MDRSHDVFGNVSLVSRSQITGKACAVAHVHDHLTPRTCWVGGKYHSLRLLPPSWRKDLEAAEMFNPCYSPPKLSAGHGLNHRSEMDERNHRPPNLDPVTWT